MDANRKGQAGSRPYTTVFPNEMHSGVLDLSQDGLKSFEADSAGWGDFEPHSSSTPPRDKAAVSGEAASCSSELGLISTLESLGLPKDKSRPRIHNGADFSNVEVNNTSVSRNQQDQNLFPDETGYDEVDRPMFKISNFKVKNTKTVNPSEEIQTIDSYREIKSDGFSALSRSPVGRNSPLSHSPLSQGTRILSPRARKLQSPVANSEEDYTISGTSPRRYGSPTSLVFSRRGFTGQSAVRSSPIQGEFTHVSASADSERTLLVKDSVHLLRQEKFRRPQSAGIEGSSKLNSLVLGNGYLVHKTSPSNRYGSLGMLENTSSQPGFHPISNDSHHSNVQSYHADDISGLNNKSAQEFSNKGFFRISNSPFRREDHTRPVSSNASSRVVPREHDFSRNLDNSHHGLVEASCEEKNSSDEDRVSERSGEEEDKTAPERNKVETRTEVYHRRWYLLALFSFAALIWNAVWSTWGPIAEAAELVFGWDDGDIAMFTWLGNVPFLVTMFPIAYLMDVKGLRFPMVLCCGLMFLGTGLRCIPCDVKTAKWLINAGQFINGIAGTVPISGPALLSGLWFPPNQRATATALSTVLGYLGACVSFIVGPMLVPTPPDDPLPPTPPDNDSMLNTFDLYATNGTNGTDYSAQKDGIMTIMYFECGAAGLLFLLVAIYFPSKPPLPPSISASIPREKYLPGLKMLARNKQFWLTAIAYSVPIGVYEVWQVVLDVNLESRVTQEEAGWMDFYATIGGCVSGMLVCRFADIFTRQIRLFLVVFYFFSAVAILWCTLVFLDILPFDLVSIYAAIVIGGVFLDGGAPLFFELVIEVSYPVGEGVTSGLLQMMCSLSGIVFLSLLEVESIGKQWMNWCFFGSVTMAVPLLFFIKTSFGRADIDDIEVDVPDEEESRTTAELNDDYEKASLLKSVKT